MEYRINVENKFAAFGIDDEGLDDPYETINKLNEKVAQAKKATTATVKPAQPKKQTAETVASKNAANAAQKNAPARTNATGPRSTMANQTNDAKNVQSRPQGTEAVNGSEARPAQTWSGENRPREDRPFRGRGGFRGRGRGGRRFPEGDSTGRREFDRRSGNDKSGVKPHEKREGGGAHNWGSVNDEINDQIEEATAAQETTSSQDDLTRTEIKKEGEVEAVKEPEVKQMTLDEWKKQQDQGRMKTSFNVRRANEGCKDDAWGEMQVLKKKDSVEEDGEVEEGDVEKSKQKAKVPISIMFNDNRRGRGRGGMNRRGFNPERRSAVEVPHVPNVADENDFPSLC